MLYTEDPVSLVGECDVPYVPLYIDDDGGYCLIDRQDWIWASQHRWYKKRTQRTSGHKLRWYVYRTVSIRGMRMSAYLHVLICRRAFGLPPRQSMVGDHINGDTLDCRRINLRWATRRENRRNLEGSRYRRKLMLEQLG